MTERERLVDLLKDWAYAKNDVIYNTWTESVAAYLLKNGVIVPPCKVGDTVYSYCKEFGRILDYSVDVIEIMYEIGNKGGLWVYNANCVEDDDLLDSIEFYESDIGKTVFLTYKEAEQTLKEREKWND